MSIPPQKTNHSKYEEFSLRIGIGVMLVLAAVMFFFADVHPDDHPAVRWFGAVPLAMAAAFYYALKQKKLDARIRSELFGNPSVTDRSDVSDMDPTIPATQRIRAGNTKIVENHLGVAAQLDATPDDEPAGNWKSAGEVSVKFVEAESLFAGEGPEIHTPRTSGGLFLRPAEQPPELLILRAFGRSGVAIMTKEIWRHCRGATTLLAGPDWLERSFGFSSVVSAADAADPVSALAANGEAIQHADHLQNLLDNRKIEVSGEQVLICSHAMWQSTVSALITRVDYILFDLTGIHDNAEGCRYELEALLASVPLDRILVVVDVDTDWPTIASILGGAKPMPSNRNQHLVVLRFGKRIEVLDDFNNYVLGITFETLESRLIALIRRSDAGSQMELSEYGTT